MIKDIIVRARLLATYGTAVGDVFAAFATQFFIYSHLVFQKWTIWANNQQYLTQVNSDSNWHEFTIRRVSSMHFTALVDGQDILGGGITLDNDNPLVPVLFGNKMADTAHGCKVEFDWFKAVNDDGTVAFQDNFDSLSSLWTSGGTGTISAQNGTLLLDSVTRAGTAYTQLEAVPAQKTVLATATVTSGFPTPSVTVTLLVDNVSADIKQYSPQDVDAAGKKFNMQWSVATGHIVQLIMHLQNDLGAVDVKSQTVNT